MNIGVLLGLEDSTLLTSVDSPGIITSFQSSPSATINAIKLPTFTPAEPSGY